MFSFQKDGYLYFVKKEENERVMKYLDRAWLIANEKPKTKKELEKAINEKRVVSNKRFLGCQY
jgi:hypothetical protein